MKTLKEFLNDIADVRGTHNLKKGDFVRIKKTHKRAVIVDITKTGNLWVSGENGKTDWFTPDEVEKV